MSNTTETERSEIHLSEAFPGERIDREAYNKVLAHLSNPRVIVTLIPGRCGSSFFAWLIQGTRLCGTGQEVFNERTVDQWRWMGPTLADVFESSLKTALAGGVCWLQIAPHRYESLARIIDPEILTEWDYSVILRRDIVAQAVSYVYALHSGVWHSVQGNVASEINLTQDEAVAEVLKWIERLEATEQRIRVLVRQHARRFCLVQFYEDLVASPQEEIVRFFRSYNIQYNIGKLTFDSRPMLQRLKKSGAIELYDECFRRIFWLGRLLSERKRTASDW